MKIAFYHPAMGGRPIGGAEIQIVKTKEYLERGGDEVYFLGDISRVAPGTDVVHAFKLESDWTYVLAGADMPRCPVVLSPIFWRDEQFER
ncbi:MAG: hypothetical protein AB1742_04625, partial [bacterium]